MGQSALVSIVVRTMGRRPRLLADALASLARQSYANIEIVVVEDGSARSAEVIEAASQMRPGAFRYEPIEKQGRSAAGNAGLAAARGEVLGFLDEDDFLTPDHVATLANALAANPHIPVAYARSQPVLTTGLADDNASDVETLPTEGDVPFSRTLLWLRNSIPIQAALFRRSHYEVCGGLDAALDALEDWDLWLRMSAEHDFLAIDAVTSTYRLPASAEERKAREQSHEGARAALLAKHRSLTGVHSFADIAALPELIRSKTSLRRSLHQAGQEFAAKLAKRRTEP